MVQRSLAGQKGVKSLWAMHAGGFAMCAPSKQIRRGASEAHISTKFTRRTHGHTRAAHGEHMDTREQHTHTHQDEHTEEKQLCISRAMCTCVCTRVCTCRRLPAIGPGDDGTITLTRPALQISQLPVHPDHAGSQTARKEQSSGGLVFVCAHAMVRVRMCAHACARRISISKEPSLRSLAFPGATLDPSNCGVCLIIPRNCGVCLIIGDRPNGPAAMIAQNDISQSRRIFGWRGTRGRVPAVATTQGTLVLVTHAPCVTHHDDVSVRFCNALVKFLAQNFVCDYSAVFNSIIDSCPTVAPLLSVPRLVSILRTIPCCCE